MCASTQWPLDLGMVRSTVRSAQGLQLSCYTFPAKKPVATIIFHHGYSVGGRFEFLRASHQGGPHDSYDGSFIQVMRDAGLTVVVMDMQGMGDSERVRPSVSGYFERFEHLAEDLLTVTDAVMLSTSMPVYWLAISMGGAVVARALQLRPDAVTGVVLLAPMLSLTKVQEEYLLPALGIRNRHLRPVMHQLSECLPTLPIVKKAANTLHPHLEQEFKTDAQNYNGGVRARVATEFIVVTEALMAPSGGACTLERVRCANALLMHARCDTFVEPNGSVAFFERAQCSGSKALLLFGGDARTSELRTAGPPTAQSELEAIKDANMWHALTQEPGAERLAAAAAKWVCECNARVR